MQMVYHKGVNFTKIEKIFASQGHSLHNLQGVGFQGGVCEDCYVLRCKPV
jgi:hypothetical protein